MSTSSTVPLPVSEALGSAFAAARVHNRACRHRFVHTRLFRAGSHSGSGVHRTNCRVQTGYRTRKLTDCLRDQRWQVRAAACNIIASLGPTIVNEICPLLHDSDENVRIAVASILVGLGEPELLERVIATS